jgi:hypothetical protein
VAVHVPEIKVISCGGMFDLMSEQEASFLVSALGLFRNVQDVGRALPRANVSLVRAYTQRDFLRGLNDDAHLLHLISHASSTNLQTGNGKSQVTAAQVQELGERGRLSIPEIVVSTACGFQSAEWQAALKACGAGVLIAANTEVTPANLTAFDMSFYSALLSQVRKGLSNVQRVEASFALADAHYRSIHAAGTPFAKFSLTHL